MQLSNFFAGPSYQYQTWFIYGLDNQNIEYSIFLIIFSFWAVRLQVFRKDLFSPKGPRQSELKLSWKDIYLLLKQQCCFNICPYAHVP